jgi:hypothetical protein
MLTDAQAVNQEKNLYGVFGRCYQLNKGLINMSFCHPDVLMHKAAIKRIKQLNQADDLYGRKSDVAIPCLRKHLASVGTIRALTRLM